MTPNEKLFTHIRTYIYHILETNQLSWYRIRSDHHPTRSATLQLASLWVILLYSLSFTSLVFVEEKITNIPSPAHRARNCNKKEKLEKKY